MQFRKKQPEVVIDATPWSGGAAAAAAVVDWANNQDGIGGRAIYAPASGGHAEAILLYRGPSMKSQIMKPGQYLTLNHDEDLGERRLVVWNAAAFLTDYEPVEAAEPQPFWQNHCGTSAEPAPDLTATEVARERGPTIDEVIAKVMEDTLGSGVGLYVVNLRRDEVEKPAKREHHWCTWLGGPQPHESFGLKKVEIKMRGGETSVQNPNPGHTRWDHQGTAGDVMAWRPV